MNRNGPEPGANTGREQEILNLVKTATLTALRSVFPPDAKFRAESALKQLRKNHTAFDTTNVPLATDTALVKILDALADDNRLSKGQGRRRGPVEYWIPAGQAYNTTTDYVIVMIREKSRDRDASATQLITCMASIQPQQVHDMIHALEALNVVLVRKVEGKMFVRWNSEQEAVISKARELLDRYHELRERKELLQEQIIQLEERANEAPD